MEFNVPQYGILYTDKIFCSCQAIGEGWKLACIVSVRKPPPLILRLHLGNGNVKYSSSVWSKPAHENIGLITVLSNDTQSIAGIGKHVLGVFCSEFRETFLPLL